MNRQIAAITLSRNVLRIGTAKAVPRVLEELGLDSRAVLADCGYDPGFFDDPENLISVSDRDRLLAHCAVAARSEHFGLLVGQRGGLESLGLVGLLVKYSPDVSKALGNLLRFFYLHAQATAISLHLHGDTAILEYQIHEGAAAANNHSSAAALAEMYNAMRELCGPGWKPAEVRFIQREPGDTAPYRKFFRTTLRFNAGQNALVFATRWLSKTLPDIDSGERRLLQKQIDAAVARHKNDLPEQVRSLLRAALVSGHIKAEQIAALFSMHPRTLNRRLQEYGISYRNLLDQARFDLARQILKDSDLAVSEIALALHYADTRSFIRAFRRLSGETPAGWRAGHS